MQQFFTFSFVCFIALGKALGQYEPMAVEGAHWVIFSLTDNGPYHHAITIQGDTVVNGVAFKKVFRYKLSSEVTHPTELVPPYLVSEKLLIGAIRDDLAQKKVYVIAFTLESWYFPVCNKFEEQLIYDFSSTIGDSLTGCFYNDPNWPPIIIDSIKTELQWGKDRKVFYTEYGNIMEGFGAWLGPFSSVLDIPVPGNPASLVGYCVGSDLDCGFEIVDGLEASKIQELTVYPNPATSFLNIELPPNMTYPVKITLFNSIGKIVKEKEYGIPSKNTIVFPLYGMNIGPYFLSLTTSFGSFTQLIFIR
jgi:hypothetical protein